MKELYYRIKSIFIKATLVYETHYFDGNVKFHKEYKNGHPVGTWSWYNELGDKLKEVNYNMYGERIYTWYR